MKTKKQQLELDMEQWAGSNLRKDYVKAVCCHPVYLTYMQSGGGGLVAKLCLNLATPRTVAFQAPLSMGFSRQEYWNGLPFPSSGDLLNPGIKPVPLVSPVLGGRFSITSATWEGFLENE